MQDEREEDMLKSYAVLFQNQRIGEVGMDIFSDGSPRAARKDFFDCYRHENYMILSVTEIPETGK